MRPTQNRLGQETSPYLLQHADNPVDWYPWNEQALALAREQDKPILLSIGYSACHWCHVMAHESFEDADTANLMNELFINIKVDREERPDLDKIYQTSYQMLNQRGGGWPLTMFLTPDKHMPIFAGTYFPKESRHGMPPFKQILQRISDFYRQQRSKVEQQSDMLNTAYQRMQQSPNNSSAIDEQILDQAIKTLAPQFDHDYGGFGDAPKFPHPTTLELCLRQWLRSQSDIKKDHASLHMVLHTLNKMAQSGINDLVGGGFCRYAVDGEWMIPHFEKMLYDNGQLLCLYADAYAITAEQLFRKTAIATSEWVMREMQSPEGGYYSSLDADSEHEEGKYYVWGNGEIKGLVSDKEYAVLKMLYRLDDKPNFEGKWHLHSYINIDELASKLNITEKEIHSSIKSAHKKLYDARQQRIRPGRDDKVLTSWNGLMIKGLARSGRLLERDDFLNSAETALDFIRTHMTENGRLFATYKEGKAHLNAYLDDYVFLIDAILELLQARWSSKNCNFAVQLMETVLQHFQDEDQGGFYFTADDHELLVYRPKPIGDDAIPSGNAIAVRCLLRLGYLLGENRYLDTAEKTLEALSGAINEYPSAYCGLLCAIDEYLKTTEIIVLRGNAEETGDWNKTINKAYDLNRMVIAIDEDTKDLPQALASKSPQDKIVAYLCRGQSCSPPIEDITELEKQMAVTAE